MIPSTPPAADADSGAHPGPRLLARSLWGLWLGWSGLALLWGLPEGNDSALLGFMVVGYATVGVLVASRHPRNAVGWMLLAIALVFAAQAVSETYLGKGWSAGYREVAWVTTWVWYVWLLLLGVFLALLFPDGRMLSRRWRPVTWLGVCALASSIGGIAFRPGMLDLALPSPVRNPFGVQAVPLRVFAVAEFVGGALLASAALLTGASLVIRHHRAHGVERQQLTWFAMAGMLTLGGLLTAAVAEFLLPGSLGQAVGSVGWVTFMVGALVGIPLATGFAIFRYHLYDIDVVINRTLVYGTLTAALLATYVVSVLVLQPLLSPATGDSDLAVAGSTLAVAALFRPARRRIQSAVDRRFYRRKYDAARTLDDFTVHLRHELDLDAVARDLRSAAEDTMQPVHISLWLRP